MYSRVQGCSDVSIPVHHVCRCHKAVSTLRKGRQHTGVTARASIADFIQAGPSEPSPDYSAIDGSLLNRSITHLFRQKMVANIGADSHLQG